jgi:predicted RNA-binding protein YlqC (UPF0109 family)
MKELIEYMAKALVDDPDQVHVEEIEGTSATIYELRVAAEDMPCGPCCVRPLPARVDG